MPLKANLVKEVFFRTSLQVLYPMTAGLKEES